MPQEAVTLHKQTNLRRAGVQWLLEPPPHQAYGVRFDVLTIVARAGMVSVHHIPGAF